MKSMKISENQIIVEGKTRLFLPELVESRGPASSDMQVFYNPVMSLNRDFSVLFFSFAEGIKRALDGLAATGARGIRIVNETGYAGEMHLNDHSPDAVEIIQKNAEINSVELIVHQKNFNTLLSRCFFDYIDIDPFGSPVEFVPLAFRSIRNRGYLAITATDTGALCGSYPKACMRRYGFRNRRNPLTHETGVRGLLGYLVRQAASCDRYIEPLLCQSINHYYRVLVRVRNGARKADHMLQELGGVAITGSGFGMRTSGYENVGSADSTLGPFYLRDLHSSSLLDRMAEGLEKVPVQNPRMIEKLLDIYRGETEAPPFYFDTDRISSFLKRSSPPLSRVMDELMTHGFSASPTQFSPTGFKTNADEAAVITIVREM